MVIKMPPNPYAVSADAPPEAGIYGDAKRVRGGFLYRLIEIQTPVPLRLRYSGWWFIQRIFINGKRVWSKVSWLRLERHIQFELPVEIDPERRGGEIEISFGPSLFIGRFRVWIAGTLAYDEMT